MTSYRKNGRTPSENTIKTALLGLSGKAKFDGIERKVHIRIGDYKDGYAIDLGDADWQTVIVTPKGWKVVSDTPVRFWRTRTMRPLPLPTEGDFGQLWNFANVSEGDRLLVTAFILECWRNDTSFPILELNGEQGTAKSTTQETLRALIDPNEVPLRAAPKNTEDMFISAAGNWLASYNNLSHLSPAMQDSFCTLATGGGWATITLYTNTDETVIDVSLPGDKDKKIGLNIYKNPIGWK